MKGNEAFQKVINDLKVELVKDETKSKRAGYDIYNMTRDNEYVGWVSDLNTRLEVNELGKQTINIWYDNEFVDESYLSYLLSNWLMRYTDEVVKRVMVKYEQIKQDNSTIKLLIRLSRELEKDNQYFVKALSGERDGYRDILSRTSSILDTLYVLWIE